MFLFVAIVFSFFKYYYLSSLLRHVFHSRYVYSFFILIRESGKLFCVAKKMTFSVGQFTFSSPPLTTSWEKKSLPIRLAVRRVADDTGVGITLDPVPSILHACRWL